MNTLIVYASSHGTTEKIAMRIAKGIAYNVETKNLRKTGKINLDSYDRIIIGGSIHAGQMQRKVKDFCKKNLTVLNNKKVALFMCGLDNGQLESEFNSNFPEVLREKAISRKLVGGEYILEKMNFIERALIRKIAGVKESQSLIKWELVDELVKEISEN